MKKQTTLLFILLGIAVVACKEDRDQSEIDREKIEKYVLDNNLNTTVHPSGMHYLITTEGTGSNPSTSATVKVKYKGYFLDGAVFDQTTGSTTVEFPLANLIEGWKIAIPLLKKEGKGTFIMPSALCYGNNPPPGIPANEVLIFDIELVDFK